MAKKLIQNYVFNPGVGLNDNVLPNAYSLILQNKVFIQKEIRGFIDNQVIDTVKCERDLGYIIDAAGFDITLGTNYNAVFQGTAEYNSNEVSKTVLRTVQRARDRVLALSGVIANGTATTRATNYFNEILDIAENGRAARDPVTFTNPTSGRTASQIASKDRLVANKNFIIAEINAYVDATYPDNDHDVAKCSRDVGYAVDSFAYDMLYGGNSATYDNARFFFYFDPDLNPGIDPTHKIQTVSAYERLAVIIEDILQGNTVTASAGNTETQITSGTNAILADAQAAAALARVIKNVVDLGTGSLPGTRTTPSITWSAGTLQTAKSDIDSNKTVIIDAVLGFKNYEFSIEKCERDSGYVIDALLFDLRYGGNEETRRVSSFYWNGSVPQIDGTRLAEVETYYFVIDLINDYIITNTLDATPNQVLATQVIDNTKTAEGSAAARVTTLITDLVEVIDLGLSALPTRIIGLGSVELLGKVDLEDVLIITNVTDNVVIYNFADPSKGGLITFREGDSENYPQARSVNNGTTLIKFIFDTSSMSVADNIQIFLEETELSVKLNSSATDAMERVKVGLPQAMLDADFEYGLQPTKWQAISMQRGYPSTYEVSASDISVVSVVTDASAGNPIAGVGASLITVTTLADHGLSVGSPLTIKALSSSIIGFNRAEGTFLINSIPSTTTFTYYAKSKVGTTNGQVLATSNTQLRQAAFYTGASVGTPTFSVASNGSSGAFATTLRAPSASTTLTFTGLAPSIGAPVTVSGVPSGTQVSAVYGETNSDGVVDYRIVGSGATNGSSSFSLADVTGLAAGMVISNGATPAVQLVITSITGNTLNLSGPLTVSYVGDLRTYNGLVVSAANYVVGTATNATFDVTVTAGEYAAALNNTGSGYSAGDTLKILGSVLGGTDVTNDLFLNVVAVDGAGGITNIEITLNSANSGTGTGSFTGVSASQTTNTAAANGQIILETDTGEYLASSVEAGGTGFQIGNKFTVLGTALGGLTPDNDCVIQVETVFAGQIQSFSVVSGTATRGVEIPVYAALGITSPTTALIASGTTVNFDSIATINVTFAQNHGMIPGAGILTAITSNGTNHQLAAGPFFVSKVINLTTIQYVARSAGTIDGGSSLIGVVYMRPDGFFTHRPFDGGVQLGTGGPQHGAQAIRMSKKYIRYQSGKGAMYNTGALFAPSFDLGSATATGTATGSIITFATDDVDHGLQAGATVRISGVATTGYDGEYVVNEITDERTFRCIATTQLGSTTGQIGPQCQMALLYWHGAIVRSGPFDDQNGIFWQYDGREIAVGLRSATFQCAGTVAINANSSVVTGTNTRFLDQLHEGDRIVIRGMTHVVSHVTSNTAMNVTPDFRGVSNVSGVKIAKVTDKIIPQSEFNLDRCDGTGPSGYNIDITKMQMIGIQFTWYGAGFIDWMLRGADGNYTYAHRLKGNNLNTEAYMRTGNLPVRYEVINESARSRLNGAMTSGQTTITLDDVYDFPTSGTVYIDNELINYTGKNSVTNQLTGCSRSAALTNFSAGASRSFLAGDAAAHNDNQGVVLVSNTTSPIISHWGSAYLIDGRFDEDRGYLFNYAATGISATVDRRTAFFIRLAPSVSNAVTGDLGERELLNRAQLLLDELAVTSDSVTGGGAIVVEGVLNPSNYPTEPTNITWNGLQSRAAGGQPSFAQIALGGSVIWGGTPATTETASVQGTLTTTITARALDAVTFNVTAVSIDRQYSDTYSRAFNNNRNDFLITTAAYDALGTKPVVGDRVSVGGIVTSNQSITSVTRDAFFFGGISYTRIVMSANANNSTNQEDQDFFSGEQNVTATITTATSSTYNRAIDTNRQDFLILQADVATSGILNNDSLTNASFITTARTISSVTQNFLTVGSTVYARVIMSGAPSNSSNTGSGNTVSVTVTARQTAATYASTNFLFFTETSWVASGAVVGTRVASTDVKFPAGTTVSGITTRSLGGTVIYRVTFTQSSNTSIAAAATITFQFGDIQFANPGEQVFSFIANPGETQSINLSQLKELTTTAIGGRGAFPNGPDVLAINVYKVSGTATNVNLILRWGEAQA